MSQLAFVACILRWQWRRIAPAAAATATATTRSSNNAYKRAKRRKRVSHSGFSVRLHLAPRASSCSAFPQVLQHATVRRWAGQGGVESSSLAMETPFQQFSDK